MKENGFYALMARMKYIGRWSLMRNSMPENVSEHAMQVSVLAHALAVIRRDVYGGEINPEKCAAAALYHDAPEILTGDLPTPVKYFNPAISSAYRAIERSTAESILSMLPEVMQKSYRELFFCAETDPETYRLVKAADKLAAYIKCIEELKSGNLEFETAAAEIKDILQAHELPKVYYFLEHFLDAFYLTLDELK